MSTVQIFGESPKIKALIQIANKIAKNAAITTLVLGENGTGKELVARYVHESGSNSQKPFVDINCGAIQESLLESELFGHVKGAFTGAYGDKKGLFELAEDGTVFLDEIANTSLNFQSKLLKVVESKRFRRVGGIKEINVSTRIIAATNVDLQQAVSNGIFREDLYYRLNIGLLTVHPLREREHDAALLAQHFLESCNKEYGRQIQGIKPNALEIIQNYPWPGNVRQLKNTIERAVLIESDLWIEEDDLKLDFDLSHVAAKTPSASQTTTQKKDIMQYHFPTQGIALEDLEKGIINSALSKAGGNLSHAARLLKISRGKLRYRLDKLGIDI